MVKQQYKNIGNLKEVLVLAAKKSGQKLTGAKSVFAQLAEHLSGEELLCSMQIECQNYAYEYGVDKPQIDQWKWPQQKQHSAGPETVVTIF